MSRSGWPMRVSEDATHVGTARINRSPMIARPVAIQRHEAVASAPKRPKYGNTRVNVNGMKFDSKREYRRFVELSEMLEAGLIGDLQHQVAFELAPAVVLDGRKKPALRYIADFVYVEAGELVVEDVKSIHGKSGSTTANLSPYRIKKHLMKTVHGIDIREVK